MSTAPDPSAPANRLAREPSPYLRQHGQNPVDWYPWGEEAFARARAEERPIFLSIGYSTCHWCHVMERETFADPTVAEFLNAHYISIKVDREERPDVDKIYMTFVQATSGQGGWPLNVFLTPERAPFYGGTYFPPDHGPGRPGFLALLRQIQHLWGGRRGELERSAAEIQERLGGFTAAARPAGVVLTPDLLHVAAGRFKEEYDPHHGGFGPAPKFPRPCQPAFLLHYGVRFQDESARRMVLHTCDRMAAGGLHDHLGGGFHRYSVDAEWRVPHFEKMLYDNAQLLHLYLDAWLVSKDPRHAAVARGIVRYVLRDLTAPEGGFYSAEDADSEGQEGKFYCWTQAELAELLTADELAAATRGFGITAGGNFVDHSHPHPLPNLNVLSLADPAAEGPALDTARAKMEAARGRRVRPALDDKVLASWNGLMLGAMARAGAVLGDPACLDAARRNLAFLQAHLWDAPSRTLHHRWHDGRRDTVQLLDAYAFLLSGVLEFYDATLEAAPLEFAVVLADAMRARFEDPEHGGFFQSASEGDLILRLKEDYDGAEPSGNSVAALALLRLGVLTDRTDYRVSAERTLRLFAGRLQQAPQALPLMLRATSGWLAAPQRVVIAGNVGSPEGQRLLRASHASYAPDRVVLGQAGPVEPFARTLPSPAEAVAYLCLGTRCRPPTSDPDQLRRALEAGEQPESPGG